MTVPPSPGPETPSLALRQADQLQREGRYADAARAYHSLLERWPDHVGALHNFGVMHLQCGYPERAADLLGRAVALRPDVPAYHTNLAEAHRALKQYQQAADCCRAALRLDPASADAANNLGLALHDMPTPPASTTHGFGPYAGTTLSVYATASDGAQTGAQLFRITVT
jgi:tetratricopeptide (TPR) repeat protein